MNSIEETIPNLADTVLYKSVSDNMFYSNAEHAVISIKQEKATPIQWLRMLTKNGGIKAGEDKWMGLSDWLISSEQSTLSKKDILAYIHENKIILEERILKGNNPYRNILTTPGIENKKEIVFWIPGLESWKQDDSIHFGTTTKGKAIAWMRFGETVQNGEKSLIIDEIQSQRHQSKRNDINIPDAPFSKNWHELAMKRLLLYAAENNFDRMYWTTGHQQQERNKSPKEIKMLNYIPIDFSAFPGKLIIIPKNGIPKIHSINNDIELTKIVGREIASQINNGNRFFENISIGGNRISEFYDNILPGFINKYCKKWSIMTEKKEILGINMHSISITTEMKESVLKGQALFCSPDTKKIDIEQTSELEKRNILNKISELGSIFTQNIEIKNNRNELPRKLTEKMQANGRYPGVYDTQTSNIYLITNEIKDIREVEAVLFHEILGHRGLRALKQDRLNEFLDKVYVGIPQETRLEYMNKYNNKYIATEEYIADQAENYNNPKPFEKITAIFKNCLRGWGFSLYFSDSDIRYVLRQGEVVLQQELKKSQIDEHQLPITPPKKTNTPQHRKL